LCTYILPIYLRPISIIACAYIRLHIIQPSNDTQNSGMVYDAQLLSFSLTATGDVSSQTGFDSLCSNYFVFVLFFATSK
jgi:hypothetical protein